MRTPEDDTSRHEEDARDRAEQDGPTVAPTPESVRARAEGDDEPEPPPTDTEAM